MTDQQARLLGLLDQCGFAVEQWMNGQRAAAERELGLPPGDPGLIHAESYAAALAAWAAWNDVTDDVRSLVAIDLADAGELPIGAADGELEALLFAEYDQPHPMAQRDCPANGGLCRGSGRGDPADPPPWRRTGAPAVPGTDQASAAGDEPPSGREASAAAKGLIAHAQSAVARAQDLRATSKAITADARILHRAAQLSTEDGAVG